MAVEARLGDQHTNLLLRHKSISVSLRVRKTESVSLSGCSDKSAQ
jgi:hypothetical protein